MTRCPGFQSFIRLAVLRVRGRHAAKVALTNALKNQNSAVGSVFPPLRPSARLPVCPSARLPVCPSVRPGRPPARLPAFNKDLTSLLDLLHDRRPLFGGIPTCVLLNFLLDPVDPGHKVIRVLP